MDKFSSSTAMGNSPS